MRIIDVSETPSSLIDLRKDVTLERSVAAHERRKVNGKFESGETHIIVPMLFWFTRAEQTNSGQIVIAVICNLQPELHKNCNFELFVISLSI